MSVKALKDYFESTKGLGVIATADSNGKTNVAVYSRPHVMDDGSLTFIMPDRLTHKNLSENPSAAYLFREDGGGYRGKRLYLKKIREEQDSDLLHSLRRRTYSAEREASMKPLFLVFFSLESELPLIGSGDDSFDDIVS